jgi:hypothetical protein
MVTSLPWPFKPVKLARTTMVEDIAVSTPVRLSWCPLLALALTLAASGSGAAQTPEDSLAERLRRAEEAIERLQRQLEEQAQAKVQSRLRNSVELSGLVLVNAFYNNAKVNNSDVPLFVDTLVTPGDTALPVSHLGAAVRQTRIGLSVSGARALGATLSGELQLDFYGGQLPSSGGRTRPLLRVRTAAFKLDWPHVGVLVGQESPLVAPHNPVSFASVGFPGFTNSGNLWLWIPQVRLTLETGRNIRVGLQGAALAPMVPVAQPFLETQADTAERSRRPTVEGRLYAGWSSDDAESQIGLGVHRGWIARPGDSLATSEAFTADWRLAFLGGKVTLLGEAFFEGQALGGLGGGGIGQNLNAAGVPVRTRGGWAQLNLRPTFEWELGGGAGFDNPVNSDLGPGRRLRNLAYSGHLHWRPGGGLLIGFEFRRIETTYPAGTLAVNHLNWFAGVAL